MMGPTANPKGLTPKVMTSLETPKSFAVSMEAVLKTLLEKVRQKVKVV